MFYNPMWNLMGDFDGSPGSHFYDKTDYVNYYWHIFDQVVLRKPLIDNLENLQFLTSVNDLNLTIGKHKKPSVSDHLPLYFSIT